MKQDIIQNTEISGGNVPGQRCAETVAGMLQKNDLIIRDSGCFTLNSLKKTGEENAFFPSRLFKGANVYLSSDKDAEPVSLPKYLNKEFESLSVCDINVHLGEKEKLPCRVIACRLYRARRQTGLTFKYWKSLLSIDILKGTRRERIGCFLYGRLTAIVILT